MTPEHERYIRNIAQKTESSYELLERLPTETLLELYGDIPYSPADRIERIRMAAWKMRHSCSIPRVFTQDWVCTLKQTGTRS